MPEVEVSTPANTPEPIGPYNHVAKVGGFITVGGVAGVIRPPASWRGPTSSRRLARSSTAS
jgi:2-iminobutanoate/2-iminopropanoate deaminase